MAQFYTDFSEYDSVATGISLPHGGGPLVIEPFPGFAANIALKAVGVKVSTITHRAARLAAGDALDEDWQEAYVEVAEENTTIGSTRDYVGVGLRIQSIEGRIHGYYAALGKTDGEMRAKVIRLDGDTRVQLGDVPTVYSAGQVLCIRMRVAALNGAQRVYARSWLKGVAEPSTWSIEIADDTYTTGYAAPVYRDIDDGDERLWGAFGLGTDGDPAPMEPVDEFSDTPEYEAHVLADNPYHYYRLNEGTGDTLVDAAGAGGGTLYGAERVVHEGLGRALRVGEGVGYAQYATGEFSAAIRAGDVVVIELWVRGLVDNASQYLATITNESGDTGVVILNDSTGGFIFQFAFGDNGYVSYLHENAVDRHGLDDGAWHHVAAVLDPVALSVMWIIDGAPDDSHVTAHPYGNPSQIDLASFTPEWGHMGGLVSGDPPNPYYGSPVEIDELLLAPYVSVARITERYQIIHPPTEEPIHLSAATASITASMAALQRRVRMAGGAAALSSTEAGARRSIQLRAASVSQIGATGILARSINLSASSTTTTTSNAHLTRRARLGATSESVSAATGTIVRRIEPAATAAASSAATGSVSRTVHLSAQSVTTTGASLQVSTAIRLRATAAVKTGTDAALTRQAWPTGAARVDTSAAASLNRAVRVSGEGASHTASVGAVSRSVRLSAISATATSASLQADASIRLAATATVTSSASAGLHRRVQPVSITEATSSTSGALARRVRMRSRADIHTGAGADVLRAVRVAGSTRAVSAAHAILSVGDPLPHPTTLGVTIEDIYTLGVAVEDIYTLAAIIED